MPESLNKLSDLPIVDQVAFWDANQFPDSRVLTRPMHDGIVFKTGGSTGRPKRVVYSQEEWQIKGEYMGKHFGAGLLEGGDRVANMYAAGDLYASFMSSSKALEHSPFGVVNFPLAQITPLAVSVAVMREFRVNAICGLPTVFLELADYVEKEGIKDLVIKKFIYAGEPLFGTQLAKLARIFPGARAASNGYYSIDGGILAYCDESCENAEFREHSAATIMEIVDEETGEVIEETGRAGRLLTTQLARTLMPIIRYPCGDMGEWLEPSGTKDRKFRLKGRSNEGVRIVNNTLYYDDVQDILNSFSDRIEVLLFQMQIRYFDDLAELTIRIAVSEPGLVPPNLTAEVLSALDKRIKGFKDWKKHPARVEWISMAQVITNPRTRKLVKVIDIR